MWPHRALAASRPAPDPWLVVPRSRYPEPTWAASATRSSASAANRQASTATTARRWWSAARPKRQAWSALPWPRPAAEDRRAQQFTYAAAPTVSCISPGAGPLGGGTVVTLTGTNLGSATVTFGGRPASVTSANGSTLVVVSPAAPCHAVNVTLATPGGSLTLSGEFTYVPAPTLAGITPTTGALAGGASVTITGTNLGSASVSFGGNPASVTSNNGSSLVVTSPAGAAAGPVAHDLGDDARGHGHGGATILLRGRADGRLLGHAGPRQRVRAATHQRCRGEKPVDHRLGTGSRLHRRPNHDQLSGHRPNRAHLPPGSGPVPGHDIHEHPGQPLRRAGHRQCDHSQRRQLDVRRQLRRRRRDYRRRADSGT